MSSRLLHPHERDLAEAGAAAGTRRTWSGSRSLAFYLACYLAAAVIPLFAVIVLVTHEYVTSRRVQVESHANAVLDGVREEIDRDVASKISMLQALATSPAIASRDFAGFRAQAVSVLGPDGVAIILRDPHQRQVVNTRFEPGATLPSHLDDRAAGQVFVTGQPFVSDLYTAQQSKALRVSVSVPVMIDGHVAYALSFSFALSHLAELMQHQPLAKSYYASVTDRTGKIVSRSGRAEEFIGTPLPGFDKATGSFGRWEGINPQGVEVIGFYRRSILTGWLFSIGVDRAVISEPLYNSLRRLAMLCGAILLIGSGLTFWVRKHLGLAFARLGALAASPEAATNRIASGINEVDFVGGALAEAFGKLQVQAEQLETAKAELENKVDQRTLQLSESAAELALSNARFEAAIANMTQGLCMLDAEQRVMVCNDRFRDLYKLSWEQSCPGTYLSGMLEHRRAAGTYSGPNNPDALKAMLQAGSDIRELRDGRTIRILRNPMSGGRIMTTHEDITDIKRAEHDLDETKRFLDTIVENLPMAVLAKEAATGKFVLANRAYEDYIGVPRERFIGATVHELYAPEVANVLDGFDRDACALTTGAVVSEFLIPAPDGTERVATTTRMAVRNSKGEPSFLIVIIEEITKKRLAERRIAYLAHYDVLTGLANRATFIERLEEALEGNAAGDGFALHLIDLDHFKEINDSLGHAAGDELLFQIAHRLKTAIHPDDVCARLGGDEFAIIQRSGAADAAAALGERIVSALKEPMEIGQSWIEASASVGIALAPRHGTDAATLMKRADLAMYRAKAMGRGRAALYEDDLGEAALARRRNEAELRQAVANREFVVHYQPIYDLRSGAPCAVEALVRWLHPIDGLRGPDAFIPLAEETGLISALGQQVLEAACRQARTWPETVRLCVNVSPKQLSSGSLVDVVSEALQRSGLAASRLEMEVTETAIIGQSSEHLPTLRKLKALGVSVSLDDFGAGYSSLGQLTAFPFDRIKIDKSLIRNIVERADARAVIVAVQSLADALQIPTTAEGVETQDQLHLLRLARVQTVQGFLMARPQPAEKLDFSINAREQLKSA